MMKNISIAIALGILGIGTITSAYFFSKYQTSQKEIMRIKQNPSEIGKEEVKQVVDEVSKLILLPNEEPTLATVSDKDKLKDQPFFAQAENGDKVLIYSQAKEMILYRPSINKIIEVGQVNIGSLSQPLKVVLYNGSNTTGLTNLAEKTLESKLQNIQIIDKENASKKDYTQTLVIDLKGNLKDNANEIAKTLGGKVSSLPDGEQSPKDADILIIVAP